MKKSMKKAMKASNKFEVDDEDSDLDGTGSEAGDDVSGDSDDNIKRDKTTAKWFKEHEHELSEEPWLLYYDV